MDTGFAKEAKEDLVVVVDDEPAKRYSVSRVLKNAGYTVVEAATGREALEAAQHQPAVILLDIRLPDMNGYDVCHALKQDSRTSSVPLLLLSASFTDSEHRAFGLNLGADGYLTHPVEANVLLATVRSLIRLRKAETEARAGAAALDEAYRAQKRIAETLQRSLLIEVPEEGFANLRIVPFYEAAWDEASVGGDFYDTYHLDEDKVVLVIGDATGKGLAAAVRTAEVKFALRAYMHEHGDPARALRLLNTYLCDASTDIGTLDSIVAVTVGLVDTGAKQAVFAAAGAEAPLILASDGSTHSAHTTGVPVGAFPQSEYENVAVPFKPGDTIILATDGITEARRGKEFLAYDGMVKLAARHLASSQSLQAQGNALLDAARSFAGGAFQDDVCILLARYD